MKKLSLGSWINIFINSASTIIMVLWFVFGTATNGTQNSKDISDMKQSQAIMQTSINTLQSSVAVSQAQTVAISKQLDTVQGQIQGVYKLLLDNKTALNHDARYTQASY